MFVWCTHGMGSTLLKDSLQRRRSTVDLRNEDFYKPTLYLSLASTHKVKICFALASSLYCATHHDTGNISHLSIVVQLSGWSVVDRFLFIQSIFPFFLLAGPSFEINDSNNLCALFMALHSPVTLKVPFSRLNFTQHSCSTRMNSDASVFESNLFTRSGVSFAVAKENIFQK